MNVQERTLQEALAALTGRRFADAERLFRKVLRNEPNNIQALNLLTIVLTGLERYAEAEKFIARAVSLRDSDASFYNYGLILDRLGRPQEASQQFDRAIALNGGVAESWRGKAKSLGDLGRYAEAQEAYNKALSLKSDFVEAWVGLGAVLVEQRQVGRALAAFQKASQLNPSLAEPWIRTGNILSAERRHAEALRAFDRALELQPAMVAALVGRAGILIGLRRLDEALAAYDTILAAQPNLSVAWLGRSDALLSLKRFEEAIAASDRALQLSPEFAEAWLGRGNALGSSKDAADAALDAFDRALRLKPNLAAAWVGRANVLCDLLRYDEARVTYDKALALEPGLSDAWLGRGNVLALLKRHDEALGAYDKALLLDGESAKARLGRGDALRALARYEESLSELDRAIALDRQSALAWLYRGAVLVELNRLKEAVATFDEALSVKPDFPEAISSQIFVLDFMSELGFAEQQQARAMWWERIGAPLARRSEMRRSNTREPERRLKIGYVSADFRSHSAAFCFQPVLLNHDRNNFEITCYSCAYPPDAMTARFQQAADAWREVYQTSDEELAVQVRDDRIDILIDLSGHSSGSRLGVFARKPAPVQVTAWGHATGTGLKTIDYLFSDPVVCPPPVRHLFAEKIIDLPCFITIDPLPDGIEFSEPPVSSKGYVTFGVFNRASRISDDALSMWSRILRAVPESRIVMKHRGFDVPSVCASIREKFAVEGIADDRISFLGGTPRREHFAAFRYVDISLDPFPNGGGISTWESLQMGVPVVSKLGNGIGNRAGGAILSSIGLHDWVADDEERYFQNATKFAAMPEYLKALRLELPSKIAQSDAGNSVKYTRAVEAAYRKMWEDYCRGTAA